VHTVVGVWALIRWSSWPRWWRHAPQCGGSRRSNLAAGTGVFSPAGRLVAYFALLLRQRSGGARLSSPIRQVFTVTQRVIPSVSRTSQRRQYSGLRSAWHIEELWVTGKDGAKGALGGVAAFAGGQSASVRSWSSSTWPARKSWEDSLDHALEEQFAAFAARGYVVVGHRLPAPSVGYGPEVKERSAGLGAALAYDDVMRANRSGLEAAQRWPARLRRRRFLCSSYNDPWIAAPTDRFKVLVSPRRVFDLVSRVRLSPRASCSPSGSSGALLGQPGACIEVFRPQPILEELRHARRSGGAGKLDFRVLPHLPSDPLSLACSPRCSAGSWSIRRMLYFPMARGTGCSAAQRSSGTGRSSMDRRAYQAGRRIEIAGGRLLEERLL